MQVQQASQCWYVNSTLGFVCVCVFVCVCYPEDGSA